MANLRVSQVYEIANKQTDRLIEQLNESNRTALAEPLIEPQQMRAYFVQLVARHLMDTHEIVADD